MPSDIAPPSFPLTRGLLQFAQSVTPRMTAGRLFHWSAPDSWLDYSSTRPIVGEHAREVAISAFRREFSAARDAWDHLPQPPRLGDGARLEFHGITREELRSKWTRGISRRFPSVKSPTEVTIRERRGVVVFDAEPSLETQREDVRRSAQNALLQASRASDVFVAPEELLISRHGWVVHVKSAAKVFGVSEQEQGKIRRTCGSLVEHLIHADSCRLDAARLDGRSRARVDSMNASIRKMRTAEADEALLTLLGLWHEQRDGWAANRVTIGEKSRKSTKQWAYVDCDEFLSIMVPGIAFRSAKARNTMLFLLPLAVLSRATFGSGAGLRNVGRPALEEMFDCGDPVVERDGPAFDQWLQSLPAVEGFCVRLGQPVLRLNMSHYQAPGYPLSWGSAAVRDAKKARGKLLRERRRGEVDQDEIDEIDETIETLEKSWSRTKGYVDYFWVLPEAAMALKWRPSARALARTIFSNLASSPPRWQDDPNRVVVQGERYWSQTETEQLGERPPATYFPALGRAASALKLDTLLVGAGYAGSSAEVTSRLRLDFLDDLETLAQDLGLEWHVPGHGGGSGALQSLRNMVRSRSRWGRARFEPRLPARFLENLEEKTFDCDGPEFESQRWTPARIVKRKNQLGLTQKELAELVGVTPAMVSLVLSGKRTVSDDLAERLDTALGRGGKRRSS